MALYYLPILIRSDRYFISRLDSDAGRLRSEDVDFNFVIPTEERVLTPLLTIEDPARVVLIQMAPSGKQDIPLRECHISLRKKGDDFELVIRKNGSLVVEPFEDNESGIRLDYQQGQKRISVGYYRSQVNPSPVNIQLTFEHSDGETWSAQFGYRIVPSKKCQRVVVDFGSEASQVGYKNCGPQSAIVQYDILENIISRLNRTDKSRVWKREDFLNNEQGQPLLYRSYYAVKKNIGEDERKEFPFNFNEDLMQDEIRLFITRQEVGATETQFRDNYEIIPNLKLGIERSLQLGVGDHTEDYSIRSHKKELISAVLLRLLRLMISTKPDFRTGGMIVTLLVPNIYTQHDVFELLSELRMRTSSLLESLHISSSDLSLEFETISESDAAFMGYQQTHAADLRLLNGEMALVIDCGKGTTDISMLLADENENYSSFFRTGFAGAGNVLSYGFAEDFLTLVLRAIPGSNEIVVKDFITKQILDQNLTVDVLNFIQFIENHKKSFNQFHPVSLAEFAELTEPSQQSERKVANLYKDPSNLLQYTQAILANRNIRWDDEVTGLIQKAIDCIVHAIIASIRDVVTKDVRKRVKVVMLSGRAFYFEGLRKQLVGELASLLGPSVQVHAVAPGRAINNKNVAIHGAFSGAYKITDFTGIPVDKKEGLSKNRDVLNNNLFLYRGIKIEPGNDILYNTSVVRRNHSQLIAFKNKTVDIYFTRDNIYLRLMENQQVRDVRSLYSLMTPEAETGSPVQDLRMISLFPGCSVELPSLQYVWEDLHRDKISVLDAPVKKRQGILQFFQF